MASDIGTGTAQAHDASRKCAIDDTSQSTLGPIVIDTNIWLDLLMFRDPSASGISRCFDGLIDTAGVRIASCQTTRAELADVLTRPGFGLSGAAIHSSLQRYDSMITDLTTLPAASLTRLRCRDRLDQKFLELAVCSGARALLTRDKALLRLAKRARREHNFQILDAAAWLANADDRSSNVPGR